MNIDQTEVVYVALKILSKPDWSYKRQPGPSDCTYPPDREAIEKMFLVVYDRPLDADTHGVHWLARAIILQAIAHNGFFQESMGFWKFLFYLWSVVSTVGGFVMWWYLYRHAL